MSAELTMTNPVDMAPDAVRARMDYARTLAVANMIPKHYQHQPANVLVAVETGAALGIPPVQALQGITVISGKATLTADLMGAVIRRAGHKLRIIEDAENMTVTAELIRRDDPDFTFRAVWNVAKAQAAGLWGGGAWKKYPLQMMRARAISEVARQGASEVLFGCIYTPEELGAHVDVDGEVIDVAPVAVEPQPEPQRAPEPTPPVDNPPAPEPTPEEYLNPAPGTITQQQTERVLAIRDDLEIDDYRLAKATLWCSGKRTNRGSDLSQVEAARLIAELERQIAARGEQPALEEVEAEIMEDTAQ